MQIIAFKRVDLSNVARQMCTACVHIGAYWHVNWQRTHFKTSDWDGIGDTSVGMNRVAEELVGLVLGTKVDDDTKRPANYCRQNENDEPQSRTNELATAWIVCVAELNADGESTRHLGSSLSENEKRNVE